jgi:hypothetical protein
LGVHHEKRDKYAFYCGKKEDLSLVYWLRWQQIIGVKYTFYARQKKEDFSQITT